MPKSTIVIAIIVAALGYFVDVYDIILFTAVRLPSLRALGLNNEQITSTGMLLLNCQLVGMMVGGVAWGMLGDKKGRLSILFGSILLYSLANIANAFVSNIPAYAFVRFIAGFGLAGELGAGVTLVSELLPASRRGLGTMLIASCGVMGGVVGGLVGDTLTWQSAYLLGGFMGLGLLFLRWRVVESPLFRALHLTPMNRGNPLFFLRSADLRQRYFYCLLLGAPIWIFIGIFVTLSPELAKALHVAGVVSAGKAITFFNIGFGVGDLSSSLVSQWLKSRKRVAAIYLGASLFMVLMILSRRTLTAPQLYGCFSLLGLTAGYWAIFLMLSTEQFGTNLRATASTSLPNFVRGMVLPLSLFLGILQESVGIIVALGLITVTAIALAFFALARLRETYGVSMEFVESL